MPLNIQLIPASPKPRLAGFCALALSGALTLPTFALPVVGSSSGLFQNPTGGPGLITTGVGTSAFTWGDGAPFGSPPSSLNFTGTPFATSTGSVFSFGTLGYYNGTTALGTEATGVEFWVNLNLLLPLTSQNFDFGFNLITTPNTLDPLASADIVQWGAPTSSSAFHYAGIDYTLEFLGFGTISGPGYSTVNQFHVLEGQGAHTQLLGRITNATPEAVPEPTTLALFGLGLLGLGIGARRRAVALEAN